MDVIIIIFFIIEIFLDSDECIMFIVIWNRDIYYSYGTSPLRYSIVFVFGSLDFYRRVAPRINLLRFSRPTANTNVVAFTQKLWCSNGG
jgi:hypothetical protein